MDSNKVYQITKKHWSVSLLDSFNACLKKYDIKTSLREAHFLAQILHETGNLRYREENLNYSVTGLLTVFSKYFINSGIAAMYQYNAPKIANKVYANRIGNGGEDTGEGWRYRGRGAFQLTGKDNYIAYGKAIGEDFIGHPELVASDEFFFDVAGWYWKTHKLNVYADKDDVRTITRKINGGLNGLADRKNWLNKCKLVLL